MEHGDMLVDILRHLPPLALAVSRSVCKAWRAVVDDHGLLRADLLPLSLDGVIYEEQYDSDTELLGRRPTAKAVSMDDNADSNYPEEVYHGVIDCCNGLVLLRSLVVANIATRQWAKLPDPSNFCPCLWNRRPSCHANAYLAYDPAVSPHYQVLFVPRAPRHLPAADAIAMEWPPSRYAIHVFSSKTKCWTERSFLRQGDDVAPAGTVQDVLACGHSDRDLYCAAYWKGSLYLRFVQRGACAVLRVNLTDDDKYQIIQLPNRAKRQGTYRIGKSKKGVYCVVDYPRSKFQIWLLFENTCGTFEWLFKDKVNLESISRKYPRSFPDNGPWILHENDEMASLLKIDGVDLKFINKYNQALAKDDFQWDSDDESAVAVEDCTKMCTPNLRGHRPLFCLGLHPYKEIVLFHDEFDTRSVFAYHLNSSKVRYIGKTSNQLRVDIEVSFPYSTCWTMDLPGSN